MTCGACGRAAERVDRLGCAELAEPIYWCPACVDVVSQGPSGEGRADTPLPAAPRAATVPAEVALAVALSLVVAALVAAVSLLVRA